MFKYIAVICIVIACALAKPSGVVAPLAYVAGSPVITATSSQYQEQHHNHFVAAPAPLVEVGPPVVTATSSQYQVRNHNHVLAAVPAPLVEVGPPVVTATSNQYQVRHHNAIAAPIVAAPAPIISSYAHTNSWNLPYYAAGAYLA